MNIWKNSVTLINLKKIPALKNHKISSGIDFDYLTGKNQLKITFSYICSLNIFI